MDGYDFTRCYPGDCHIGDILLLGDQEKQYLIMGVNRHLLHRQVGLYVARVTDDDDPIFHWKRFYVRDWLIIYRPKVKV